MDQSYKDVDHEVQEAGDVETLPTGKSTSSSNCHSFDDEELSEARFELESARLEVEASEAIRRAAEANRRAAEALRRRGKIDSKHDNLAARIEDVQTTLKVLSDNNQVSKAGKPKPSASSGDRFSFDSPCGELNQLAALLNRLELPKTELPYFDGSAMQYVMFFRQFDEQIESRVTDSGQCLTYLYHYCQGRAKEAIQGCLLYPASEGYKRARMILKDLFGQRHLIVRAMLDEVTGPGDIPAEADGLSSYANKLVSCADALEKLGYVADLNSVGTIEKVLSKLPRFLTTDWVKRAEEIYQLDREPTFRDLCEFVSTKSRIQRNRYSYLLRNRKEVTPGSKDVPRRRVYTVSTVDNHCTICQNKHSLENCGGFLQLSTKERWTLVSKEKLCFICLQPGHRATVCRSKKRCNENGCFRFHHRLLHATEERPVLNASCQRFPGEYGVVLGIVPVIIEGPSCTCYATALLDTGADTSLIRQDLARKLGIHGKAENVSLNTPIGSALKSCTRVAFRMRSMDKLEEVEVSDAYTVDSILDVGANLPSKTVLSRWKHLKDISLLPLVDPVISILIGLDAPEAHWVLEQRRGKKGDPYADYTPLGWVLRGPLSRSSFKQARAFTAHLCLQRLEEDFRRLYDAEFTDDKPFEMAPSVEDELAVDIVEKSVKLDHGRFCMGLPWKDNNLRGLSNKSVAVRRLYSLGRRLRGDLNTKERYAAVIDRYIQKGYAIQLGMQPEVCGDVVWYLPHHSVVNLKKPDKVRVVFDCAATFKGESLNGHLLQGPNLLSNLVGILLRFRQMPVALSADIEDMFLQVKLPEADQDALRFLWWPNGDLNRTPVEHRLTVHPFGAVSSPFCANFALRKAASLFGHEFSSLTAQVILENFYVDDCLVSVSNESDAIVLVKELTTLLSRVGFRLTKWLSNERRVLQSIPSAEVSSSIKNLDISHLPTQRTLGIAWDMEIDCFHYSLHLDVSPLTRRKLLSQLATVYDPLGWVSPYVLPAKQMLQDLCKRKVGWDDPLDIASHDRWKRCKQILAEIKRVQIQRWYAHHHPDSKEVELHVFCDASEVGYGAVGYLRFTGMAGPSQCELVIAKSRVAPLKVVTIPRMELSAAVLAVELANVVKRELRIGLRETIFWTDSVIVLYYLNDNKSRFATFVANRIRKIRDRSSPTQWRHVAGKDNPADLASRGATLRDGESNLWFSGPAFLRVSDMMYSKKTTALPQPDTGVLEFKNKACISSLSSHVSWIYFDRFSSWLALMRGVAWLLRFKQYLIVLSKGQRGMTLRVGPLTVHDLRDSNREIMKAVQSDCFYQEVDILRTSQMSRRPLRHTNLRKLDPVILDGLLCVGGRLQWSDWPEENVHPIILPPKHRVTELLVKYYHEVEGHVGCSQVLAAIRRKYWIIQGRAAVRRVVGRCLKCKRESARPCWQQMAPLPRERITHMGHAFAQVGVDYFGPLLVRHGRVREKRYGCLFTCLNIRAVHIEISHSLTTDSFIQALVRFISRRGQPSVIFSDNGSNLKGAYAQLRPMVRKHSQGKIQRFMVEHDIEWHFGPPEASHWGGIWERMIRSIRKVLRGITASQTMTDETLLTFVAEAERIVNDRPLVPVTDDVKDLEVLTPNKLLLLRGGNTAFDHQDFPKSCVRLWRRVQLLADTFWRRWKTEYLSALQERHRWFDKQKNLKPGDLVLVIVEKVHRNQWPMAIVEQVFPGSDGLIREAIVRTSRGTMKRDVRSLCLLEGNLSA